MKINLQQIREVRDLSITDLAKLSGVSKNWICRIEAGKASPSIGIICKLAMALHVSLDELVQCECNED